MKPIILVFIISILQCLGLGAKAQTADEVLPIIYVNTQVTTHFVFFEPLSFVDISTKKIVGHQPEKNILRIKPTLNDSIVKNGEFLGIVTLVGQKHMIQYKLIYHDNFDKATKRKSINSEDCINLIHPDISLSTEEMKAFCIQSLKKKPSYFSVKSYAYKVTSELNNIFTVGDYFFIDISFKNHTNIKYTIDQIRFKIEDKKRTKRTNFQQIEISPEYQLYNKPNFKNKYRNIYVFKKFTFPNQKVFTVEIAETQISGRTVILEIDYTDVLNADTL